MKFARFDRPRAAWFQTEIAQPALQLFPSNNAFACQPCRVCNVHEKKRDSRFATNVGENTVALANRRFAHRGVPRAVPVRIEDNSSFA